MQTEIIEKPPTENELRINSRSSELLAMAERAEIDSADAFSRGTTLCKLIRDALKIADTERLAITEPFRRGVEAINNRFKLQITSPLEKAQQLIDGKMLAWRKAETERVRKEAEEKAKAEREAAQQAAKELAAQKKPEEALEVIKKSESAPLPVQQKLTPVKGVGGGTASTRPVWKFQVVDPAAVPDEYKLIDEKKIGAVVKAGVREIAGVRIYSEETLVVGR